jgi:hypothetical protein
MLMNLLGAMLAIGKETLATMEEQPVFSFAYKRKLKARMLASARMVKVAEDRTIDPALLFQRFLVVSQTGDLSLEEVLSYELSPYPPSLFEEKNLLRKVDKAQLLDGLKNHVASCSDEAVLHYIPEVEHNILDGGSLLHRLKWTEGKTYSSIANDYADFTVKHYGKATVIFDGYGGRPNTKDHTHQQRSQSRIAKKSIFLKRRNLQGRKKISFPIMKTNRP